MNARTGRHPLNVGHLVMGLAFFGLVGIWALIQSGTVTGDDVRWLLPLPWVLAGLAGILATVLNGRRRAAAVPPPSPSTRGYNWYPTAEEEAGLVPGFSPDWSTHPPTDESVDSTTPTDSTPTDSTPEGTTDRTQES